MPLTKLKMGFTLVELLVVVAIIGLLALVVVTRIGDHEASADIAACRVYKGNIEVQTELWRQNTGAWPAADLGAIGSNLNYFPEGLPNCPVDGNAYTIDPSTGLVVGHNH